MSILLLSIFIVLRPVSAATYHVYERDGWQVLHDTIQNAPSGSTIYVHAGTYYILGPIDIMTYSNITVIGDSPHNTIIDAKDSGGYGFLCAQNYFTIKNITVRNAPYTGIRVASDYSLIENCIVYGSGNNGFEASNYCTFKNCLSYDNGDDGFDDEEECTYINCTAANNGDEGFYSLFGGSKYENCISFGNTGYGFYSNSANSLEIIYSNAWDNQQDYSNQVQGTGSISVDPKFVDGINTFYLSTSSPCVDKGSDKSATLGLYQGFTTRTDGRWDTGTVDMGFHYSSNRGPPSSLPIAKILEILKGNKE